MADKYLGRPIKERITFKAEGTFQSLYLAQSWCNENGYQYGSLCRDMPVAMQKGEEYDFPQKWKNFEDAWKMDVDGVIISNDFREAQVEIIIFN